MANCVVILGGSFDPIHNGHLALCTHFAKKLHPDEIRVIPTGSPWQKEQTPTEASHRVEMIRRAFASLALPISIDQQEIERGGPTYTIDTLKHLRASFGPQASLVFLLGADQLQQLDTWKNWRALFEYAHLCGAARPGYSMDASQLPPVVAEEFSRRSGSLEQIRNSPHGLTHLSRDLAIDVSATEIRASFMRGEKPVMLVPPPVLDYIEEFHLYKD